jgi:hypothetical protein
MMKRPSPAFRLAVGTALALVLAVPSFAQTRHRVVKRVNTQAAALSGTVIDAVTRAPLADAVVRVGDKALETAADGKFSFTDLTTNTFTVKVTRWGYGDFQRDVPLALGANQLEVALQPGPVVTVRSKSGTTYPLDSPTVLFGYVVAFVGWQSWPELHVCLPTGEEALVKNEDMKSVAFPGIRTETTSCCSLSPGAIARITKRDGTVVEGTVKESCTGAEFFVRGRNRTTGKFDAIKLSDTESVTFP